MKLASRPKKRPIGTAAAHRSPVLKGRRRCARRTARSPECSRRGRRGTPCRPATRRRYPADGPQVVARLVEQHEAEPAAEQHAERHVEEQVVDLRRRERDAALRPERGLVQQAADVEPPEQQPRHVGEPVPLHGEGADLEGYGIERRERDGEEAHGHVRRCRPLLVGGPAFGVAAAPVKRTAEPA